MINSANNFTALFRTGRYRDQGYMAMKVLPNAYVLNKPMNQGTDARDYHQRVLADGRYLVFLGPVTEEYIQTTITSLTLGFQGSRAYSFQGGINGLYSLLSRRMLSYRTIGRIYDGIPASLLRPKTFNYDETNVNSFATVEHGWTMVEVSVTAEQWEDLKPFIKDVCPYGYRKERGLLYICGTSQSYKKRRTIQAQLLRTAQEPFLALLSCIMTDNKEEAKQWYYTVQRDVFNRRVPGVGFSEDEEVDDRDVCWDWDKHETGIGDVFTFLKRYIVARSGTIQEACKICVEKEDFV